TRLPGARRRLPTAGRAGTARLRRALRRGARAREECGRELRSGRGRGARLDPGRWTIRRLSALPPRAAPPQTSRHARRPLSGMSETAPMPLEGLRVLDCATLFAGPVIASMLGDFGADVIKVEHPRGDALRSMGWQKDGVSLWWALVARNKRCITLK